MENINSNNKNKTNVETNEFENIHSTQNKKTNLFVRKALKNDKKPLYLFLLSLIICAVVFLTIFIPRKKYTPPKLPFSRTNIKQDKKISDILTTPGLSINRNVVIQKSQDFIKDKTQISILFYFYDKNQKNGVRQIKSIDINARTINILLNLGTLNESITFDVLSKKKGYIVSYDSLSVYTSVIQIGYIWAKTNQAVFSARPFTSDGDPLLTASAPYTVIDV